MPRKRRRYNDDVDLVPYKPDRLHYSGPQREGIREPLGSCRNYDRHAREALEGRFPLPHVTPLPAKKRDDAAYVRDNPPGAIIKLWDAQLSALDELARGCRLAQSKRNACIPEEISPSAGKFQTVAMDSL